MFNISTANPLEVVLAVCFVIIAVLALIGTFAFALGYVFSNIKERWREYSNKKRFQVIRNVVVTVTVIVTLIVMSSQRLR